MSRIQSNPKKQIPMFYYSLEWSTARASALLLIKPPSITDEEKLMVSKVKASLLDVAPTTIKSLRLNTTQAFDGIDLFDPAITDIARVRYYHFFEKKGPSEWTDQMMRFRIDNSQMILEGSVMLKNNKKSEHIRKIKDAEK